MIGGYRAGVMGIILGLLVYLPAVGQSGDTVRVGAEPDTGTVAPPAGAVATDTASLVVDTSAVSNRSVADASAEPVVLRAVADSAISGWKKDPAFAYANDSAYWRWHETENEMRRRLSGGQSSGGRLSGQQSSDGPLARLLKSEGFKYFLLIILGGVLVFAIVRIIVMNRLQLFYRPPKPLMAVNAEDNGSPEDDLEGRLLHFIQIRDYRQAVRYLYLKTLRLLNDREMIRYHQESTNQEYWHQLRATPQAAPFRDLTSIYEKVWYGEFPLGESLFTRLHQYFKDFYKSVRA